MTQWADDTHLRDATACFTGHRQLAASRLPDLVKRLDLILEELYRRGYRRFFSGGALGFDVLAADRVIHLRRNHPDVKLILALPCSTQSRGWNAAECRQYEQILYAADETRVLSQDYYEGCMHVRNRHMVDRSSFCICYLEKTKGGTVSTVAYASQSGVPLLNLAMPDACDDFINGA